MIKKLYLKWKYRHFDSNFQYGDTVSFMNSRPTDSDYSYMLEIMHESIERCVPCKYRSQIVWTFTEVTLPFMKGSIIWKYNPANKPKDFLRDNSSVIKTCKNCKSWDSFSFDRGHCDHRKVACALGDSRDGFDIGCGQGDIPNCGSGFGCVHWEEKS